MNILKEIDEELFFLESSLTALEVTFSEVMKSIKKYDQDLDSSGLLDEAEFLVGLGFTICQRYITGTLGWIKLTGTDINKTKALAVGDIVKNNITYVAAINSGANYWKHSDEWVKITKECEDLKIKPQAIYTMETLGEVTDSSYYPCSNLLFELLKSEELRLTSLIPIMKSWRNAIISIADK